MKMNVDYEPEKAYARPNVLLAKSCVNYSYHDVAITTANGQRWLIPSKQYYWSDNAFMPPTSNAP